MFSGSKVQVPPTKALLLSSREEWGRRVTLTRVSHLNHPSDTVAVLRLPLSFDAGKDQSMPGQGVELKHFPHRFFANDIRVYMQLLRR